MEIVELANNLKEYANMSLPVSRVYLFKRHNN